MLHLTGPALHHYYPLSFDVERQLMGVELVRPYDCNGSILAGHKAE